MAANIFASNADTPNGVVTFDKPIDYINIYVASGVTCSISFDGTHYMTVPSGLNSFKVGQTKILYVNATGAWQIIAVQA